MEKPLVVVVEDEEHLAQGLIFNLEAEGYRTHHEADGEKALRWLLSEEERPAAVLLDVMLPGRDGFSIVRALRERERFVPVLMLTARGRAEDVVEGILAGADDYLPKPFDLEVLLARLAALLRRMRWQGRVDRAETDGDGGSSEGEAAARTTAVGEQTGVGEGVFAVAGRTVDLPALEIRSAERTVHLTLMEADLLRYLLERPGKVIGRKELLENVWRVREDTDTRAIDNFIVRLRRYLEPDPATPVHLVTVRGVGYRFLPEP